MELRAGCLAPRIISPFLSCGGLQRPKRVIGDVPRALEIGVGMGGGDEPVVMRREIRAAPGALGAPALMEHLRFVVGDAVIGHAGFAGDPERKTVTLRDADQPVVEFPAAGVEQARREVPRCVVDLQTLDELRLDRRGVRGVEADRARCSAGAGEGRGSQNSRDRKIRLSQSD